LDLLEAFNRLATWAVEGQSIWMIVLVSGKEGPRPSASTVDVLRGSFGLVFAMALMGLGVWIFVSYSLPNLDRVKRSLTWPEVPCRIVYSGTKRSGSSDDPTYRADIHYTYRVGDRTYTSTMVDFLYAPTGTQSEAALLASQYPVNSEHVCFVDPENPSVVTLRRGYRPEHAAAYMPLLLVLMGGAVFVGVVVWLVRQHRAAVAASEAV
jgi:hypothetical protein